MRFSLLTLLCAVIFWLTSPATALATPTQFGNSGLLSLPDAQTLNEGNICVGLWTNCGFGGEGNGVIVPTALTLGLGTFMEAYGSYPNLLFNNDEDVSGRGFANLGFKFRAYGKRADPLRIGLDFQVRRTVSDNPEREGLIDYATTAIGSYNKENYGAHAVVGYVINDSPDGFSYDNQMVFGGGLEYYPINRLRGLAEFSYETEKGDGLAGASELTVGFQYFLTPHLTLNFGTGFGFSDASPDLRVLFGLSTCQGVGTFNRPVPKLLTADKAEEVKPAEPAKKIRIKTLSPLTSQAEGSGSPTGQLELPLPEPKEQVLIKPEEKLPPIDLSRQDAAVSPLVLPPPNTEGPLFMAPFKATLLRKFRLPEQAFNANQYDLSPEGQEYLAYIAEQLRRERDRYLIRVEGFTDNIGSEQYNQQLSLQRAITAATVLVLKNGLDPNRTFVKGFGEGQPLTDNDSEEGRAQNRRVELLVLMPLPDDLQTETAPAATVQN
jgi:outer membrane protein OmpA-like peptidoglycan-associated protein